MQIKQFQYKQHLHNAATQNFKKEHFLWNEKGRKRLEERAKEQVEDILKNHKPSPLPDRVVAELDMIEREVLERVKAD